MIFSACIFVAIIFLLTLISEMLLKPRTGPPERAKTSGTEKYYGELLDLNNPYRWDNR